MAERFTGQRSANQGRQSSAGGAHAPYNFVSLPDHVMAWEAPPPADRYDGERLTGQLELTITTETPLYIRGTTPPEQANRETPATEFFAPSGQPAIPGSSLRGMLRTLIEIVGAAAFDTDYDAQRRFAYRTVADPSSPLGQAYRAQISQVHAGHLERGRDGLRIVPAQQAFGQRFWQIKKDVIQRVFDQDIEADQFSRRRVYFQPTNQRCSKTSQICCVDQIQAAGGDMPTGWLAGWLILSGYIEKKSHGWVIADPDERAAPVLVPNNVAEDYRLLQTKALEDAVTRVAARDRFPLLPKDDERLPCFYTVTNQQGRPVVSAFGHTRWFRLNYRQSVGHAVPAELQLAQPDRNAQTTPGAGPARDSSWDLATSLFGRVGASGEARAGRVFVEDAVLAADQPDSFLPPARRQILATPKLTTVQHYLEPRDDGRLQHWDSPQAQVRGYKLYWHRPGADWQEPASPDGGRRAAAAKATIAAPDQDGEKPLEPELIHPVAPGARFHGRLRFENLTSAELGALLFVLNLPEDCRHHLGQGKPLGLGSVHITTDLRLDDRPVRYMRLFAAAPDGSLTWARPTRTASPQHDDLLRAFAQRVLAAESAQQGRRTPGDPIEELWRLPRMQALRALLDFQHAPSATVTAYMRLEPDNEYSGRPLLPPALVVYGRSPTGSSPQPFAPGPPALPRGSASPETPLQPTPPPPSPAMPHPPRPGPSVAAPSNPTRPENAAPRRGPQARLAPQSDLPPGGTPTLEDLARRFKRQDEPTRREPKNEGAGDKAKREQRELMERLRRDPRHDHS